MTTRLLVAAALAACRPEPTAPDRPAPTTPPAPSPTTPAPALLTAEPTWAWVPGHLLAGEVTVDCAVPCALRVSVDGPRPAQLAAAASAAQHALPVFGLTADAAHTLTVTVEAPGYATDTRAIEVTTAPLPADLPDLTLNALAPHPDASGVIVAPIDLVIGRRWVIGWDVRTAEIVLLWESDTTVGDLRRLPDGNWLGLVPAPVLTDPLFRPLRRWTSLFTTPIDVPFPYSPHHEIFPDGDSYLTLIPGDAVAPAYPTSVLEPEVLDGPADLLDARVLRFDDDGQVLADWSLAAVLDTQRIGFDARDLVNGAYDWVHANAVIPDGDGVIVSARHQDALVRLDAEGQLDWILGDPAGWREPWASHLLQPLGDLTWPYHAHAPHLGDDDVITLFDNHNDGHTPYTKGPTTWASRAVQYRVDPVARTVEELWSYATSTALQSPALGDADPIPQTDLVLIDFGFISRIDGAAPVDLGLGNRSVRLLVVDRADDQPIFDLEISTGRDRPGGVKAYRAVWAPTLYPPGVVEDSP
jgi:hypothetical protein